MPEPRTAASRPQFWLALVLLPLFIGCAPPWLAGPIEPMHDRRDALLNHLRTLAAEVNACRKRTGSLPQSLKDVPLVAEDGTRLPDSGYQLVVQPNQSDFAIVADHVFKDATGAEFYYACDGNLQIHNVPVADDPPQDSAAAEQP